VNPKSHRHLVWMQKVRQRQAQHVTAKSTECTITSIHQSNPLETYFSPSRDKVASKAPVFVLPSSLLPPGHVIAVEDTSSNGTPILVHRDKTTHRIRGYVNQCRHRGAALVKPIKRSTTILGGGVPPQVSMPLQGSALVCPYHAWTYDVKTGNLKGVPGETIGFPCLNKEEHALHKVECFEVAGERRATAAATLAMTTMRYFTRLTLSYPRCSHQSRVLTVSLANTSIRLAWSAIENGISMPIGNCSWKRFWNPIMFTLFIRKHWALWHIPTLWLRINWISPPCA
jgi:nitrite reductase/ring-hydroxylating ferredoxin subunit